MPKRAERLVKPKSFRPLCDEETCPLLAVYFVDDTPLCSRHAQADALVILLNEERADG